MLGQEAVSARSGAGSESQVGLRRRPPPDLTADARRRALPANVIAACTHYWHAHNWQERHEEDPVRIQGRTRLFVGRTTRCPHEISHTRHPHFRNPYGIRPRRDGGGGGRGAVSVAPSTGRLPPPPLPPFHVTPRSAVSMRAAGDGGPETELPASTTRERGTDAGSGQAASGHPSCQSLETRRARRPKRHSERLHHLKSGE